MTKTYKPSEQRQEINRLLKCLHDIPAFMSPQDYETMIEEWEKGDRCAKRIEITPKHKIKHKPFSLSDIKSYGYHLFKKVIN